MTKRRDFFVGSEVLAEVEKLGLVGSWPEQKGQLLNLIVSILDAQAKRCAEHALQQDRRVGQLEAELSGLLKRANPAVTGPRTASLEW